jgi:hypothetical protein
LGRSEGSALRQLRYLHDRPTTKPLLVLVGAGVINVVAQVPAAKFIIRAITGYTVSILLKVSTLNDALVADTELTIQRPDWAVIRARPNFNENGQVLWADLLDALGNEVSSSLPH